MEVLTNNLLDNGEAKLHLVILGNPKAQKRHGHRKRGKWVQTYDPSEKQKDDLYRVVQDRAPAVPLDGPLRLDVLLVFPRPKNHYGTGRNAGILKDWAPKWHTSRPDRDNCDKIIMDALTGIFWRDDAQVCDGTIQKVYGEQPRTELTLVQL